MTVRPQDLGGYLYVICICAFLRIILNNTRYDSAAFILFLDWFVFYWMQYPPCCKPVDTIFLLSDCQITSFAFAGNGSVVKNDSLNTILATSFSGDTEIVHDCCCVQFLYCSFDIHNIMDSLSGFWLVE